MTLILIKHCNMLVKEIYSLWPQLKNGWLSKKHVLVKHNSKGESKGSRVKFNDL